MGSYALGLVTIDNIDNGSRIGHVLVERKLAACVSLVPQIRSIYHWQGQIHDQSEALLIIKTSLGCIPELQKIIREIHPYDVPEIIFFSVDHGLPEYFSWIDETVSR